MNEKEPQLSTLPENNPFLQPGSGGKHERHLLIVVIVALIVLVLIAFAFWMVFRAGEEERDVPENFTERIEEQYQFSPEDDTTSAIERDIDETEIDNVDEEFQTVDQDIEKL